MIIKNHPVLLLSFLILLPTTAWSNHQAVISDAWIADAPPVSKIRAAYLRLENTGDHPISIKSFTSQDFDRIELHKTIVADGIVKMEKINKLVIEKGQHIMFKPGGYHLMLFNPKRKLKKGDKVKLQITLRDNNTTEFVATVLKRGEHKQMDHEHHHH
ncbi:MAG: copper chaperone PCu(A)C [Gammaproteobacteria bacterium]|nr:copper chaperone PCu(A)C [Gammaproteobacteria bacterium]